MAGPARYQSLLTSVLNSRKKSRTPLIGEMSSASGVKEEVKEGFVVKRRDWDRSSLFWSSSLEVRRGCFVLLSSIAKTES